MRIFRCGEDAMKSVIIVATGIDSLSDAREVELQENPKFFRAAIQEGARLARYDGTVVSARDIVLQLTRALGEGIASLKIQEQLSDLGKGFEESVIGVQLDPNLAREIGNHSQAMKGAVRRFEEHLSQPDNLCRPSFNYT